MKPKICANRRILFFKFQAATDQMVNAQEANQAIVYRLWSTYLFR